MQGTEDEMAQICVTARQQLNYGEPTTTCHLTLSALNRLDSVNVGLAALSSCR